ARYLAARLKAAHGLELPVFVRERVKVHGNIVLRLDPTMAATRGEEAYRLDVGGQGVLVVARTPHGLFNGAMSLLQLATSGSTRQGEVRLAGVQVSDEPRFEWRGLMLDSARHMQSVQEIKDFLDAMALHKLSVMQWHLTDDQG